MKLHPVQQALLAITSTGQLNKKQTETVAACFLQVAARLQYKACQVEDQSEADALAAGSFALASIAHELQSGGQTDTSIDYLSRAFSSCASLVTRESTGKPYDDDDERMEAHEEKSKHFDAEGKLTLDGYTYYATGKDKNPRK